jgi:hypothetical protein
LDGPETSLRFGIASATELRFSAPDYYRNLPFGSGVISGFGDIEIGLKQQLGPAAGFDVSVIVFLSLPTGALTGESTFLLDRPYEGIRPVRGVRGRFPSAGWSPASSALRRGLPDYSSSAG